MLTSKERLAILSAPDTVFKTSYLSRLNWEEHQPEEHPQPDLYGWDETCRELYNRLYSNPHKLDEIKGKNTSLEMVHDQITNLPEFASLKANVGGDKLMSACATSTVAQTVAEIMKNAGSPTQSEEDAADREAAWDPDGNKFTTQRENVAQKSKDCAQNLSDNEEDVRAAIRVALAKASDEAEKTQQTMSMIGWGNEIGEPATLDQVQAAQQISANMQQNGLLEDLIRALGKMRGYLNKALATKHSRAGQDIYSVTMGNDLGKVLPSEYLLLANEITRPVFMRKFIERQLMQYSVRPPMGKEYGDAIILVDHSSSMSDNSSQPLLMAKAFTIATIERMKQQNRRTHIYSFESRVFDDYNPKSASDMLRFMSTGTRGGTSFESAIEHAINHAGTDAVGLNLDKADIMIVTDGACAIREDSNAARMLSGMFKRLFVMLIPPAYDGGLNLKRVEVLQSAITGMIGDNEDMFVDYFRKL